MRLQGLLIGIEVGIVIPFQYNPKTVKKNRQANWSRVSPIGSHIPYAHFSNGNAFIYKFNADLTWDKGSVGGFIDGLMLLTTPMQFGEGVSRPTTVQLIMGQDINASGIVTNVEANYGPYFGPMLDTRNATYSVTFEEVR